MSYFDFLSTSEWETCSDGKKMSIVVTGGATFLSKEYKKLSEKGRLEVFLFSFFIILSIYENNHPNEYQESKEGFYQSFFLRARTVEKNLNNRQLIRLVNSEQFIEFVDSRLDFYSKEISELLSHKDYLPGRIFTAFYLNPMENYTAFFSDIEENIKFKKSLFELINWLTSTTREI